MKKQMEIGVSLGNFCYWDEKFNIFSQLKYLELLKNLDIDAIELYLSEKEIINKDYEKFYEKLKQWIIIVHLPNNITNKKAYGNLVEMSKLLNIKHFVIHADQYSKIKNLLKGFNVVVENSDQEKEGFQDLMEVKELGEDICLDINHFEENFPGKLNKEIKSISSKIKELHVSALNNKFYDYPRKSKASHYLIYGSNYKLPRCLPRNVIWVIEGATHKSRIDLLEKEIKLLRDWGR